MNSKETLLFIGATSGLLGALLTQLMTGLFSYIGDKRKYAQESKDRFADKKSEIGENFYFMNGEMMVIIQKNIAYWRNKHNQRGQTSVAFLNKEMERSNQLTERLNAENWKYNLISIYYNVPFSFEQMQEANTQTHQLYLRVLDLSEKIKAANVSELDLLYGQYNQKVFDLCSHYEWIYDKMQSNMLAVKGELLGIYS